jgi:hypothetical protein
MKVRRELKRRPTVPRVFGSGTQLIVLSVFGTGDEKAPMRHESNTRNADMTDERKVWGNSLVVRHHDGACNGWYLCNSVSSHFRKLLQRVLFLGIIVILWVTTHTMPYI